MFVFGWVFLVVVQCFIWGGGWEGVGCLGCFVICLGGFLGFFCLVVCFFFPLCFWGFFFLYFKREIAREKGNLGKLFKCCLVNGTLSPLSAVLAGILMCSHKSSTDWQLYFQPISLHVSFSLEGIAKVLLITAVKLVISVLSATVLLLNSVCV